MVRAGGEGFPRACRVRKRLEYLRVQNEGRRFSGPHYLVFVLPSKVPGPMRFGATVSRKVGNAVLRNRVKRWIRESCRRLASGFPADLDLVVIARPSAAKAGFAPTFSELASLGRRLRSI
jgi:ribonuclease P protein component